MSNQRPKSVSGFAAASRQASPPVSLPVLIEAQPPRRSFARRRAAVLLAVHLVIAVHLSCAALKYQTVSPVEPSEAMATLELGWVNAGVIFLALALLGSLVFGRFFCGWGCHMVALQDLCAWALRRVGIRPRPFRSRLLAWLPAVLAFYLFAWPSLMRWWHTSAPPFPGFTNHLLTSNFWATFPGLWMSALTFIVCGFVAVYLLGSKGFCTYGCPYGALFGAADRLSPGRILASNLCTGCGQCTAHCTSNVLVHAEVKQHGMVVDAGCMKCLDCVSVCPTGALSFGFAWPPALRSAPPRAAPRSYDVSAGQELFLVVLAGAATLAFRGLYDGPPLLLAATLGVLTAYVAFKLFALVTAPHLSLQNVTLKRDRRVRPGGKVFAVAALLWLAFTAHSGFVQWHRARGAYYLEQTGLTWDQLRGDPTLAARLPTAQRDATAQAFASFSTADRWGLVGVGEVKLGLAWVQILQRQESAAELHLRKAVALHPLSPGYRQFLGEFLQWQGRLPEAVDVFAEKLKLGRSAPVDHLRLGSLFAAVGRWYDAAEQYRACLALAPATPEAQYELGAALRRGGRPVEAIPVFLALRQSFPQDQRALVELCLAYAESGLPDAARVLIDQASPGLRDQLFSDPNIKATLGDQLMRRVESSVLPTIRSETPK